MALFGSVLTDRFGPESDVDVLVEFDPEHVPGLIALSGMERELSEILGRKADMRTPNDLSRFFRDPGSANRAGPVCCLIPIGTACAIWLRPPKRPWDTSRGLPRDEFGSQRPLQHSVVRCIEVIGEAASRLSPGFCKAHSDIPWQDMVGMRNRLIHAYFDLDMDLIWQTASRELPDLISRLEALLKES